MFRKLAAECFGTFWLVFGGCGSAVLAAAFPELGIGFAGVALAFGLTVLTMAFAVGHISGGHFNPAVTLGLWAGGRFPAKEVIGYIIAQVVGGIIAAAVLYVVASGKAGFDAAASGFASNGYGEHSPGGFSMLSAIVIEIVLTCGFLLVIHGATDKHAPAGFAPIAIGPGADPHPFDQHSSHQYLGQPGAQHRGGNFPGRLGAAAAVAVLGHANRRWDPRRRAVSHPAGKTRLTLFKARVSGLFLSGDSFTRPGDLGSVMGAILIMQGLHRSCFRDSLLFCCRWSSAIYCLFVTPPR